MLQFTTLEYKIRMKIVKALISICFIQGCGSGSGSWKRKRWKRSFSVEAEAEAEARKIPPLPLPLRGKNGKRKEIGSAILRRRTNRGA